MTTGLWPAPFAGAPVDARVVVPGSKSITNRALVLGALARDPLEIVNPLRSRDTHLMAGAMRALGARVDEPAGGDWLVAPATLRADATIDCGLAGTVMRFVPPAAGLNLGRARFDGDGYARRRPMRRLLEALRALGVTIEPDDATGLPFDVVGQGAVVGGSVTLDASDSSQFVSGLLLSASRYDRGLTLHHDGKPLPSAPHVEMTVAMLRDRGVDVDDSDPSTWRVPAGPIDGGSVAVEPDLSNAAPFLAAALVTGGRVLIPGWPVQTTQAGDRLRELLTLAGASVQLSPDGLQVTGTGTVHRIDVDLHDVGELAPVLAVLAAVATGSSYLRGIGHLRGHETDRLHALATELDRRGAVVQELPDGLAIRPRSLRGGVVRTYDDHRIAMAAAVLGLVVRGIEIENVETVAKTLPGFVPMWRSMMTGPA